MSRPYFVADQATVTVLKPVASSAFGSYKLSVPEDVDINDVHEFSAPGNELGYVASLAPKGVRVGGFARRFVRADVSVTAADTTDPDWVPSSDVDKVLTEAAARVEGDFFLESDITKAGLGPWIPFTHFEQGDLATVEIWGRRVPLPVTRIEPKVTDHDENDWSVHVGGQVLTDDEARLAENETLRQAAVQSRREVAGLESQTAKAVESAAAAKSTADAALEATGDNREYVDEQLAEVRSSITDAGVHLGNVQELVDEGKRHAETAATLAKQAGDMATKAEGILDTIDPLRDDVVRIHTEVARLGILAADNANKAAAEAALGRQYVETAKGHADKAAEYVATGQKHVDEVKGLAGAASESAAEAQRLVDVASGILESTTADKQAAEKALADAGALLNNIDGKGTSLPDALKEIVRLHQEVLDKHGVILEAHEDTLTLHGEAIRWAAMAAAQAAAAAQSAGLAAQDALRAAGEAGKAASDAAMAAGHANRAAEENAKAILNLQSADDKLEEADRKLQEQIDRVKDAERLLAQAVKILAQGVAANSAASQSALMAADENRKATQSALSAIDTLADVQEETRKQATTAEQVSKDALTTANLVKEQQAAYEALSEERDALQDSNIEMLADLQKEQLRAQGNVFIIKGDINVYLATVSNTHFSKSYQSRYLTALGSWTGHIIFTSYSYDSDSKTSQTGIYEVPVPLPDGSRQIDLDNYTPKYSATSTNWIQVQYWEYPAVQYRSKETGGSFTATQNAWTTIGTHTISRSNQQKYFAGSWRVFWGAANRGSTYGIRIVTSSGTVLKQRTTTELGPLTSLGNGRWSMYTQVSDVDIPAGQSVYFQVYCSHSGTSQRGIYKSESSASWLEEK